MRMQAHAHALLSGSDLYGFGYLSGHTTMGALCCFGNSSNLSTSWSTESMNMAATRQSTTRIRAVVQMAASMLTGCSQENARKLKQCSAMWPEHVIECTG